MRLDKYLANYGIGSRKDVKEFIKKKLIKVNGELINKADYKVNQNDVVTVNGQQIIHKEFYYLMMNKKQGVISATVDNFHETVIDALEYQYRDLFPVGRLDIDTEGLLVLTNDGKLAHELLSPKKHVEKEYFVRLKNKIEDFYKKRFIEGIILDDGYHCLPAEIKVNNEFECNLIIKEGKFHQVKRMFKALNNEVVYLKRVRMGKLKLDDDLKLGQYRELSDLELTRLKEK